jgi:hypothetical protein
VSEEIGVYTIPYGLRRFWQQLPQMTGVTPEGTGRFLATRSDAFKVLIALDHLQREGRENQREAINAHYRRKKEAA